MRIMLRLLDNRVGADNTAVKKIDRKARFRAPHVLDGMRKCGGMKNLLGLPAHHRD
jgi:hypothetical protein